MEKKIDVCLSPELIHLYDIQESVTVVVDIFRATSCMVAGIGSGVDHIVPFADLEACRRMRSEGYLIAGERDGKKVEGFDIGNSPFSYADTSMKGEKIAVTTTNGTAAIGRSQHAHRVIIGGFLNLQAVGDYLLDQDRSVVILCAGWKGKVNLEDSLFAGALVELVKEGFDYACDAPIAAEAMYAQAKSNLPAFLAHSSHVNRLRRLGIEKDVDFCLTLDLYEDIPVLEGDRLVRIPD